MHWELRWGEEGIGKKIEGNNITNWQINVYFTRYCYTFTSLLRALIINKTFIWRLNSNRKSDVRQRERKRNPETLSRPQKMKWVFEVLLESYEEMYQFVKLTLPRRCSANPNKTTSSCQEKNGFSRCGHYIGLMPIKMPLLLSSYPTYIPKPNPAHSFYSSFFCTLKTILQLWFNGRHSMLITKKEAIHTRNAIYKYIQLFYIASNLLLLSSTHWMLKLRWF